MAKRKTMKKSSKSSFDLLDSYTFLLFVLASLVIILSTFVIMNPMKNAKDLNGFYAQEYMDIEETE